MTERDTFWCCLNWSHFVRLPESSSWACVSPCTCMWCNIIIILISFRLFMTSTAVAIWGFKREEDGFVNINSFTPELLIQISRREYMCVVRIGGLIIFHLIKLHQHCQAHHTDYDTYFYILLLTLLDVLVWEYHPWPSCGVETRTNCYKRWLPLPLMPLSSKLLH